MKEAGAADEDHRTLSKLTARVNCVDIKGVVITGPASGTRPGPGASLNLVVNSEE